MLPNYLLSNIHFPNIRCQIFNVKFNVRYQIFFLSSSLILPSFLPFFLSPFHPRYMKDPANGVDARLFTPILQNVCGSFPPFLCFFRPFQFHFSFHFHFHLHFSFPFHFHSTLRSLPPRDNRKERVERKRGERIEGKGE